MQPVPPGFNDFTASAAERIAKLVESAVLPVFRIDRDLAPTFEGSGVLARLDGTPALVSAAHVFDELHAGVHLLLDRRESQPLSHPVRLTMVARPGPRVFDRIDLGFVPLSAEEEQAAGPENFVNVEPRELPSGARWHIRYLLLGYQAKRQARSDVDLTYRVTQSYYNAPELPRGKYREAGLDETAHISLDFDHRRISTEKGRGGKPDFRGMSGGGIWQFDPYTEYSALSLPPLVGFLAGPAPRNGKALFGASTTSLIGLFHSTSG
jgi:hypothetical protein